MRVRGGPGNGNAMGGCLVSGGLVYEEASPPLCVGSNDPHVYRARNRDCFSSLIGGFWWWCSATRRRRRKSTSRRRNRRKSRTRRRRRRRRRKSKQPRLLIIPPCH